jgi:hypothetical protein
MPEANLASFLALGWEEAGSPLLLEIIYMVALLGILIALLLLGIALCERYRSSPAHSGSRCRDRGL